MAVVGQAIFELIADAGQFQATMQAASDKFQTIGRRMTDAGAIATKFVTGPLTIVGAAALHSATKVGALADELFDLADQTGLSTDTLQEFRHVATVAGVEADTLATAAIKLTTSLSGAGEESRQLEDSLAAIGVSARDATGNLIPMDQLLPSIITGLQNTTDVTTRNALAADIFGRSWAELAPVLALGAAGFASARAEAHELGLVLEKDGLEKANNFRIAIDTLKERFEVITNRLGLLVLKIAELPAPLIAGAAAIGGILFVGGPLLVLFGQVITAVGVITAALPALTGAFAVLSGATGIGLAILAIGALVAAGTALVQHWDVISFEASRVWGGAVGAVKSFVETSVGLFRVFRDEVLGLVKALADGIMGFLGRGLEAVKEKVRAFTEGVTGLFRGMYEAVVGGSYVPEMVDGIADHFGRLGDVMTAPAEAATAAVNEAFSQMHSFVGGLLDSLVDQLFGAENALRNFAKTAAKSLLKTGLKFLAFRALDFLAPGAGVAAQGAASLAPDVLGRAAGGGPVSANRPLLVGEQGPELFVPSAAGQITSSAALAGMAGVTIDFSRFPAATNPLAAARDGEWQRFIKASLDVATANGHRSKR